MSIFYNAQNTQKYFDSLANDYFIDNAPREDIFLDLILPEYQSKNPGEITALDFGCGGGALVLKMLNKGIKAQGMEKHNNLCQLARERLDKAGFNSADILQGSVEELDNLIPGSYDFVILMGVFQYLPSEYRDLILKKIFKLLKPSGHLIATYQNAFFDMFTFNKYTIDFFEEKFFKPLGLSESFGKELIEDVKGLINNPNKPSFMPTIARDNIYVETTNPITIGEELRKYKFDLIQKYFYSFFFIPRLIENKYSDKLKKFENKIDLIKLSTEWYGHFMANAFLVDCKKK